MLDISKKPGVSLKPFAVWVDEEAELSRDQLPDESAFQNVEAVDFHPNTDVVNAYWLKFELDSTQIQTLNGSEPLFVYFGIHDDIEFYTPEGDSLKGGLFYKEKGVQNERFYFPLTLLDSGKPYLVRIKDHFWIKDAIKIQLFNGAEKAHNLDYAYRMGDHQYILFSVALLSVLAYAILFFLMQYLQVRERSFLFYSIYLLGVGFYFLRGFEYRTEYFVLFSYFPGSVIYLEPIILFLTHGFYAPFIYYFLDLPKKSPHLKRIFDRFFYVIAGAFVLSTIMMILLNFNGMAAKI